MELSGEHGQIHADHIHGFATVVTATARTPLDLPPEVPTVREALRAFAGALREESPMPITLGDGLWAVAMAEACYRSVETARAARVSIESP
jgi:predicted dehydrogenase